MRLTLLAVFLALPTLAQSATRTVNIAWNPVNGATGYQVYKSTSPTGPWTTPINSAPLTNPNFTDQAQVGQTLTYAVVAVAAPCTSTTPVTTVCGSSQPATATTGVPPAPAATATITLTVQ